MMLTAIFTNGPLSDAKVAAVAFNIDSLCSIAESTAATTASNFWLGSDN